MGVLTRRWRVGFALPGGAASGDGLAWRTRVRLLPVLRAGVWRGRWRRARQDDELVHRGFGPPASRGGRAPTGKWGFATRAAARAAATACFQGARAAATARPVWICRGGGGGSLGAVFQVVADCVPRGEEGQVGGVDRSGEFLRAFGEAGGHVGREVARQEPRGADQTGAVHEGAEVVPLGASARGEVAVPGVGGGQARPAPGLRLGAAWVVVVGVMPRAPAPGRWRSGGAEPRGSSRGLGRAVRSPSWRRRGARGRGPGPGRVVSPDR